jgi:arylsulfatase A-like enzyme
MTVASIPFVVTGPVLSPPSDAAPNPDAPNVLLIITDDQRAGTMRPLDATRRWFKRGGVRFSNAFATTPLCSPSRVTVMTGRYAHNHGIQRNRDSLQLDQSQTLQRRLQDSGYLTAIAGKFLNDWPVTIEPPDFDRWATFNPTHEHIGYHDVTFNVNGNLRQASRYSTDFIADRAAGFLDHFETEDERPWFALWRRMRPTNPSSPHGGTEVIPFPSTRATPRFESETGVTSPDGCADTTTI